LRRCSQMKCRQLLSSSAPLTVQLFAACAGSWRAWIEPRITRISRIQKNRLSHPWHPCNPWFYLFHSQFKCGLNPSSAPPCLRGCISFFVALRRAVSICVICVAAHKAACPAGVSPAAAID
jgi:hypothetical protein